MIQMKDLLNVSSKRLLCTGKLQSARVVKMDLLRVPY